MEFSNSLKLYGYISAGVYTCPTTVTRLTDPTHTPCSDEANPTYDEGFTHRPRDVNDVLAPSLL
jgi:hypothetical protein